MKRISKRDSGGLRVEGERRGERERERREREEREISFYVRSVAE